MPPLTDVPLTVQVGLGVGYLCYLLAYSGRRRGHTTMDAAFLSFAFGVPALIPITLGGGHVLANVATGSLLAFGIAILWRAKGQWMWKSFCTWADISTDDGLYHGWDGILARPNLRTSQISVHTEDGRILCLNDRTKFRSAPFEGLYLGMDGSVLMIVEEEELPDGTVEERTGITHPWGTRLTFIPASQIKRVNIRML